MADRIHVTVAESGGDYTTLDAVDAGEGKDLTASNEYLDVEITGEWDNPDTTIVELTSFTTGEDNYINIYTDSTARHAGILNETTKYRLKIDVNDTSTLLINRENYCRVTGLQVIASNDYGSAANSLIRTDGAGEVWLTKNLIVLSDASGAAYTGIRVKYHAAGLTCKIWNNIIYAIGTMDNGISSDTPVNAVTIVMYNNTICNCTDGVHFNGNVTLYMKNNIIQGCTNDYNIGSLTAHTHSNNISEDDTSPDEDYQEKEVLFNDEDNNDFHLSDSDTEAVGNGVDLSTDSDSQLSFEDDIDGETRATWDIGADYVEIATSSDSNFLLLLSDDKRIPL